MHAYGVRFIWEAHVRVARTVRTSMNIETRVVQGGFIITYDRRQNEIKERGGARGREGICMHACMNSQ